MMNPSLLMLFSAFLYSWQNVVAKYSGNVFGFWMVGVLRGLVGMVISCFFFQKGDTILPRHYKFLLCRSVLGGATLILLFHAVVQCGISITTTITATSHLWTALIGRLFMPEKYQWAYRDVFLALWCLAGVIMISFHGKDHFVFCWSAILSAICQAGVNLSIKKLDDEPTIVVAFWGMTGSVIMGLPGMVYELVATNAPITTISSQDILPIIAIMMTGVLSLLSQYLKTLAIQLSSSMSVLVMRYMDIFFAMIWGVLFFHEVQHWNQLIGAGMIVLGCLVRLFFPSSLPPSLPLTQSSS